MKQSNILLILILALFSVPAQSHAQGRYVVKPNLPGVSNATLNTNVSGVAGPAAIVLNLNYPQFNVNAVAVILTPIQAAMLAGPFFNYSVKLERRVIRPNTGPTTPSWPLVPLSAASGTVLTAPPDYECCGGNPHIYVVDTGVRNNHTVFDNVGTTFEINSLSPQGALPYKDYFNHGTRMAGCISGSGTGLLTKLGLGATIVSVNCYTDLGVGSTFESNAKSAIYNCIEDHQKRIRDVPYLRNHGSVLLFAHSTMTSTLNTSASGRFQDIDKAVEDAWAAGLTVVLSAGNQGGKDTNSKAINAARVSPAGADWARAFGSTVERYFSGSMPSGWYFQRGDLAEEHLIVAGAHSKSNVRWVSSNINSEINGTFVAPVDILAPGVGVTVPWAPVSNLTNINHFVTGSGTSYSAAYTAANAAWVQTLRPWATPKQVRDHIIGASNTTITSSNNTAYQKFGVPAPQALNDIRLTYAEWIAHYAVRFIGNTGPLFVEYYCGMDPDFPDAFFGPKIDVIQGAASTTITVTMPKACYLPDNGDGVTWRLERKSDHSMIPINPLVQSSPCVVMGDGTEHKVSTTIDTLLSPGDVELVFTKQ